LAPHRAPENGHEDAAGGSPISPLGQRRRGTLSRRSAADLVLPGMVIAPDRSNLPSGAHARPATGDNATEEDDDDPR
jgi:hypothetical protein